MWLVVPQVSAEPKEGKATSCGRRGGLLLSHLSLFKLDHKLRLLTLADSFPQVLPQELPSSM